MTEFLHSEVLFAGDDGLPIQFNIQNTIEKEKLEALINHGGGVCTHSDEAIILVSPGTKVLTSVSYKNLISSRYILDCVKEDCLLDVDEYRVEINEMEASDFSDSSNLPANSCTIESSKKLPDDMINNSVDLIQPVRNLSPHSICPASNHDFDFQDSENCNDVAKTYKNNQQSSHFEFPLESSENHIHFGVPIDNVDNVQNCAKAVPDSPKSFEQSVNVGQKETVIQQLCIAENRAVSNDDDPVVAIVSSSQENHGALDQFDNMILNKVQEKPNMDEDSLSQSYTVSSSADAQISPNQPPSHHTSAEIFNGSSPVPDSASQATERQQYISNLEKEIEQTLQKPSPKSLQDKIVFVKYICAVKKLAPAIVLKILQNF